MPKLIDYYPPYLAMSAEIQAITQAVQPEIDLFLQAGENWWDDMFLETASEYGITRRENMIGLQPASTDLEQRRATVRSRYMETRPFTEQSLRKFLDTLLTSYNLVVNKEPGNMYVKLTVNSGDAVPTNLYQQLRAIVPANMAIDTPDHSGSETIIIDEGEWAVIYAIGDDVSVTNDGDWLVIGGTAT